MDATFGAGGYSRALLERGAGVVAFDRDPSAARFAQALEQAYPGRFRLINRPFSELEAGLRDAGEDGCDGVVFDLGVSSMQIDEAERGFSFMRDGPLDMRMSQSGETAADLVNVAPEAELIRLFRLYGEEPKARRIASALVRRRSETPFSRTLDLADTIERAVGGRRGAPTHPATKAFQALRIAVNDELDELETALEAAERALRPGGRLATVTFHSLEDRIVKTFLTERAGRLPSGSRHLPPGGAGAGAQLQPGVHWRGRPSAGRDRRQPSRPVGQASRRHPHRGAGLDLRTARETDVIRPIRSLFQTRFRGFRIIDLSAFGFLAVLVLSVYAFKANQGGESARIEDVDDQIASEQRQIRVLDAELAHLQEPARLERLSIRYLGLGPTSAKHETSVDALIDISRQAEATHSVAPKPGASKPLHTLTSTGATPLTTARGAGL